MPTYARRQIVAEERVGVYHCIARRVRRAFLCGFDPYTGQDFSHHKKWILDRVRELGHGQQALAVCRAGRRNYPDDVELSFLEAALSSELGDLPAAEALLLRLLGPQPADSLAFDGNPGMRGHMARHNLARIYRAQGHAAEAEAQWRGALAAKTKTPTVLAVD
jgi:hypothetical protein